MIKIEAFKSKDGFISEDSRLVEEHDEELDYKAFFNKFVDDHGWSGMSKGDISDMLYECRDEIFHFFMIYKKP